MNDRLEQDLKEALKRRQPRAGFDERVMARIPQRRFYIPRTWAVALAAALILVLFAGTLRAYREQQRRQRAEQVRAELIYALELTSVKLQETRSKLFRKPGGTI